MGPYLQAFYSKGDTRAERDAMARDLLAAHIGRVRYPQIELLRVALDEVGALAARPPKVRKATAWRLYTHLAELAQILEQARLTETRLAHEVATVQAIAQQSGEHHPNFARGSTLPDWVSLALPVLHNASTKLLPSGKIYRDRNRPSPALAFVTDAICLFRPGTSASVLDRLWAKLEQSPSEHHKEPAQ